MRVLSMALALFTPALAYSRDWQDLFNGKNLDGWETRGECVWTVMTDGTLLGQRLHPKPADPFGAAWPIDQKQFQAWLYRQAWLYTTREFAQFDLHVEYWIPPHGNSGVSIRDVSHGHYAIGEPDTGKYATATTLKGTPAHIGYEIQILDGDSDRYPSGSVYLFAAAKKGVQKPQDWNSMDIESRNEIIRVKLNGQPVAESAGIQGVRRWARSACSYTISSPSSCSGTSGFESWPARPFL